MTNYFTNEDDAKQEWYKIVCRTLLENLDCEENYFDCQNKF